MHGNLVFIRHGMVDLPYASHDDMPIEVLNDLATRRLDPESDRAFYKSHEAHFLELFRHFSVTSLYRSESKRCLTLASFIRESLEEALPRESILPELNELSFDITQLVRDSKDTSLSQITDKLYAGILDGKEGVEHLESIAARIERLLTRVSDEGNTLFLSHGYFLRFMETYLRSKASETTVTIDSIHATPRCGYFEGFAIAPSGDISHLTMPLTEM